MISIVIPTYNEKKNILSIFHNFKKIDYNFEVIFVDDNSNDGTIQSIRSLINAQKKKNIKFLLRKNKVRDLSCSIVEAVVLAKFKYILVIDADLQHDFSNINLLIQNMVNSNCDVVIGSRFKEKKINSNLGLFRTFFSLSIIFIINLLFTKITTDPLSGFFVVKKEIITKYKDSFFCRGYKILFDILYNSKNNIKSKEIKINFNKRKFEKSKISLRILILFINQICFTLKKKI